MTDALPSSITPYIKGIVGEAEAAQYHNELGWVGSLSNFQIGKGYWIEVDSDSIEFIWNLDEGQQLNNNTDYKDVRKAYLK